MNNDVGPNFNLTFNEIRTCESCEQCTGSSQKNIDAQNAWFVAMQTRTTCNLLHCQALFDLPIK